MVKELMKKQKKISNAGINKMILDKSHEMYKTLLQFICDPDHNIGNRYAMARGLQSIPNINKFFDGKWYYENFICPMKDILLEYPIVYDGTQYFKLTSVYLPKINKEEEKEQAYEFICKLFSSVQSNSHDGYFPNFNMNYNYGNSYSKRDQAKEKRTNSEKSIPTYEDSLKIEETIWEDDDRLHFVDIEQCVQMIEKKGTINELKKKKINGDVWVWLDSFLSFIEHNHRNYLYEHAIIPNMNSKFIKQTKELASSTTVPENMIECIEKLEIEWKNNHIHKNIKSITTGTDHGIDYAVLKIRECLKNKPDKKLVLMHYIPNDCEDEKFKEKRELIYEFCRTLWRDKMSSKEDGTKFPIELWSDIDGKVFEELLDTIHKSGQLNSTVTIPFLYQFLECVSRYINYDDYKVIPNKNEKLCSKNSLYRDDNIPSIFKECLKECFNEDINEELIHDDITVAVKIGRKGIFDYSQLLNKYFNMSEYHKKYMPLEKKIEAAKYLIRIIPKLNDSIKSNDDPQNKQRKLNELYKIFTRSTDDVCEIDRSENNEKIWKDSNKYIITIIKNKIESYSKTTEAASYLGKTNDENDETIKYLNEFISFSKEGKIIPNQNGKLCIKDSLYNEGKEDKKIPEELKDIAEVLNYNVKDKLVHKDINIICSSYISYEEVCQEIDNRIIDNYKDSEKRNNNKDLKEVAQYIIEEYFEKIGDDQAQSNFPKTYAKKDDITLTIIYDKNTRKNMTLLRKKYGEKSIPILLRNEEAVKKIISEELKDEI